ncbi:MAG TPA: LuxR C-terminal-related transcriptional regulator [Candidatus Cybelea sp.]|jgi:DNA-binding CsgD family transcriptional regulator|nr:LuxR C-terminal-related transcriptional regulator [Candidatus Cybelea sp.]
MQGLFARAQYLAAGDVYDAAIDAGATPSYAAELLAARILLKRDENRAVAFLIRRPPKTNASRERGEWALLLAVGYSRMRDFERADHHFEIANALMRAPAERARLAYQRARRYMLEGEVTQARHYAEEMGADKSLSARITRELLDSFILSQEERYHEEGESLIRAIHLIGKSRDGHLEEWFHAVQNLALLGRELAYDEAIDLARASVDEDVEWPPDFAAQRFQALKAVGWSCALRGDLLGCFRYLRAAESAAPSAGFEAVVLADRAYFARIVGERNWATNELAKAEMIADGIEWNELNGEERLGLLLLAEAMAEYNLEKAHFYLARYKGLDRIRSPLHLFAFDKRCDAFAAYCEGLLKLRSGEAGAEEALRDAWVTFDRTGYDWRAGRTALKLYEATKKDRWRHLAEDKLERFPRSWLATEIARQEIEARPVVKLPPMQRKVLDMLCQKMSTAEIAQDLQLSQHTIRNHLKAVFKAYGVNNRASLVAEIAQRGEMPSLSL